MRSRLRNYTRTMKMLQQHEQKWLDRGISSCSTCQSQVFRWHLITGVFWNACWLRREQITAGRLRFCWRQGGLRHILWWKGNLCSHHILCYLFQVRCSQRQMEPEVPFQSCALCAQLIALLSTEKERGRALKQLVKMQHIHPKNEYLVTLIS